MSTSRTAALPGPGRWPGVGLVVPVAGLLLAACSIPGAPSSPSGAPSESVTDDSARPAEVGLAALPRGGDPEIGYVEHGVLVEPGGERVALPSRSGISAVAAQGEGHLVADTRFFEGTVGLARVDAAGDRARTWCSGGAPALSRDGATAWVTYRCPSGGVTAARLHVLGGASPLPPVTDLGTQPPQPVVAGFVGSDVVVSGAFAGGGVVLGPRGRERAVPDLLRVLATDGRSLVLGAVDVAGRPAVVDVSDDELLWRGARADRAGDVAPGGLVVGRDRDGWVVWDVGGGPEIRLAEPPGRTWVDEVVWEDDEHVLAIAELGGAQALVRLGLDGSLERASPVVATDAGPGQTFVFAAAP